MFWQKCYPFNEFFCPNTKIPVVFAKTKPFLKHLCKNNSFGKNLVLNLALKNICSNQNAWFFKLQYLTNKLRYEVEFLDVTKGSRKQQIWVVCFNCVLSGMPGHAQSDNKWWVSQVSRMSWVMKLFFCMW